MFETQIEYIRSHTDFKPEIALVLGSGLGGLADKMQKVFEIGYGEIEGMPVSTAPSHRGKLIFGYLSGRAVVAMQGRVHLYEGYSPQEVVFPIRLLRALGADKLLLTNAAGGIDKELHAGEFMLIKDHISSFVSSPLIGKNDDTLGVRFPDMSRVYSPRINRIIKDCAMSNGIALKEGVYVQLTGPQFETPAEIKMLGLLGADAVGMSTVIEAIAAKHCGFEIGGISLIANLACGLLDQPLSGEEVTEAAEKAAPQFERLITEVIKNI